MNRQLKLVASTLALTLLILFSFKSESLWTDEAFSAFIACHRTYSSLWHALSSGDSSDLQMWLYYTYLHFWISVFGYGEFALRSANIPFVLIFATAVAWVRNYLFCSSWVWVAGLSPLVWAYAGDARPYMTILALSTVIVTCLVASSTDPRFAASRALPWIALVSLLIALNLHMLTILLVPPCLAFVLLYARLGGSALPLKPWMRPLAFLSPLFLGYFVFLIWTFQRGTSYDYAPPDALTMGSVFFRFLGLAGFAPNRHYDVSFAPYLVGMVMATLCLLAGGALVLWPALRRQHAGTVSLLAALILGLCEVVVLSVAFKQQVDVRHFVCLFALVLFMLFSGLQCWQTQYLLTPGPAIGKLAFCLMAVVWLVSDVRMTFLAEYRREDFRAAVARTIQLRRAQKSEIAIVADPAAVAYYGISVKGFSPCFPLTGTCEEALAEVPWPSLVSGQEATFWKATEIEDWLKKSDSTDGERVLLISRSRHPIYLNSQWWKALRKSAKAESQHFHGFFVYLLSSEKY